MEARLFPLTLKILKSCLVRRFRADLTGCLRSGRQLTFELLSPSLRHSPLEKSSHSSHTESSVFKQPPPLEPPMSSPPPSLRDPPWPHGGTPPGRPSTSDRPPSQGQRKDSSLVSVGPGHRVPRPYNKVASSKYMLKIHTCFNLVFLFFVMIWLASMAKRKKKFCFCLNFYVTPQNFPV